MIGTTIAHYKITEKIGQGGMGEVYRATDTKLNRDVALKVLPEAFAQDQQRMARFSREAQVLASLNHPNIASIYGLEESDGKQALVLELVEGEDLAERLKRGAIPLEESLKIALQMAEALEAAHEKGIIHRDLKPANVKITPEGVVKVLDFGLAKALEEEVVPEDISQSPTISQLATKAGIILGTAAYMSPEQARGKQVDRRTDIWAFGAVLYEMLAGQRAFGGQDASEILASVIKVDIDWSRLPKNSPRVVSRWLRRCLEADLKRRLQHIGDFRIELEDYLTDPLAYEIDGITTTPTRWKHLLPWSIAGVALVIAGLSLRVGSPVLQDSQPVTQTEITLPSTSPLGFGATFGFDPTLVALSPDGRKLVFVGKSVEGSQLYLRLMDDVEITPMEGTEGAIHAFFLPTATRSGF